MSCRERLQKFLGVIAAPGSSIAAAFGGSEAAQQQLMQVFTKARQEAQEQPMSTAEKALNQARTRALFARFTKAGIEIPSHSRSGLPKVDAQAGYSALLQAIEDAEKKQVQRLVAEGLKPVEQRIVNAERSFVEFCMEQGFTEQEGEKILAVYYRKDVKAIIIQPSMGQFSFTHGEFAERDVLQRALDMANEQKPAKKKKAHKP